MLIDWKSTDERHAPKQVRGDPSKSHEKHVQHEKQRRNHLAQAIDEINDLIPSTNLSKRTKLATLQEAAEYFRRVQDMACILLRENRRLAASLQEHGAQPATISPTPRSPILGTQEYVYIPLLHHCCFFSFPPPVINAK